jgi:integrase
MPTFKEYVVSQYLPNLYRRQVRPSTVASYSAMLDNHIYPRWSGEPISHLNPARVESLLSEMSSYSAKYQRNVGLLLQAIFNHAVDSEALDRSPMRPYHMAICRPQEKPAWTEAEISRILSALPIEYRLLFQLLALTGMRIGEALALRWVDVDVQRQSIYVHRSAWRACFMDSTKTAVARTIPLAGSLAEGLKQHRLAEISRWLSLAPEDLIFRGSNGRAWSPDFLRREILYPALAECGLPSGDRQSGFPRFRHSAGSIVVSRTGNLKLAQTLLGHSSISTTADIYTHVQPREIANAVDILEQGICKNP